MLAPLERLLGDDTPEERVALESRRDDADGALGGGPVCEVAGASASAASCAGAGAAAGGGACWWG
jgi:hypothetical protein